MKILKEEMDKLLIEVNYQKKIEFEDNDLNNFYNYLNEIYLPNLPVLNNAESNYKFIGYKSFVK